MESLKDEKIIKLPSRKDKSKKIICGHIYHELCLHEWMRKKRECPLCKTKIKIILPLSITNLFERGYILPMFLPIYHELSLQRSNLTSLEGSALLSKEDIQGLNIGNNQISSIPPEFSLGFSQLTFLSFYKNNILELKPGMFKGAPQLQNLILAFNRLSTIPPKAFSGLKDLKNLSLYGNRIRNTADIADDAFAVSDDGDECIPLINLNLSNNWSTSINPKALAGLTQLQELGLRRNNIPETHRAAIQKIVPEGSIVSF